MRRKLVGGSIAVLLALFAVWFFAFRNRGEASQPVKTGSARSAKIATGSAKPAQDDKKPELPRIAPKWMLDVDPEGPLTLEGQVVGPDGKGVAKAEVWLGSVPPRTIVAED